MPKLNVLAALKRSNALLEGHFLLSSGLHSPKYMQCALLLQHPDVSAKLCKELARICKPLKPTVIVGPALGGIIVAYELARAMKVRGIFAERSEGSMTLRRGFTVDKKDRIIICEDVITTGKSTLEVKEALKKNGAKIVGAACIADRSAGKAKLGVPLRSLIKLDFPALPPEECPLCRQNIPFIKPGSRTLKKHNRPIAADTCAEPV